MLSLYKCTLRTHFISICKAKYSLGVAKQPGLLNLACWQDTDVSWIFKLWYTEWATTVHWLCFRNSRVCGDVVYKMGKKKINAVNLVLKTADFPPMCHRAEDEFREAGRGRQDRGWCIRGSRAGWPHWPVSLAFSPCALDLPDKELELCWWHFKNNLPNKHKKAISGI